MLVNEVHGVLLAGGSAFGLGAAAGVMRYLEERGIGFAAGVAVVPIVPGAALFDLGIGDPKARPGPSEGYGACDVATDQVEEGTVGAGTGATVAKIQGPERQVKGGIGSASATEDSVVVGALFAVNAVGEILAEDGEVLAGVRSGAMGDKEEAEPTAPWPDGPWTNTIIGVVATNARLSKERAHLLAGSAHDAVSGVVRPAHTIWDGDTVFTLATGQVDAPQDLLEQMANEAVAESIRRGVLRATGVPGAPSVGEAR
jgi:L-aminopeptidase/D-esterase-like protein